MTTIVPHQGKSRLCATSAIAALIISFAASAVQAQDAASPADTAQAEENVIIVTGSRIARPEFSFPNPVQAFTAETLERSGKTNLTEFLTESPALLGSQSNIDVAGSNLTDAQSVGVNELDLRNLGTNRTLVLVNGRRHVAGYPGTAAVDINTIPTDLVERVDVLTGGASAIYGADGVSGVVNFILKRNFEGLRVRGQTSISQRGDAGERFVAATAGKNFADGRGNVTMSYEFNETDRFSQRKRLNYGKTGPSYVLTRHTGDGSPGGPDDDPNIPDRILQTNLRWADSSPGGAVDLDGDLVPDFTGEGGVYDLGEYVPGTAFTIGGSSTPRESYYGDFTPYTKRHNANIMASFEFSPALRLFAEGKYVRSSAWTVSQPSYDFYTTLYADNAFLNERYGPAVVGDALISRDNFDFGIRRNEMERKLYRAVIGADGELTPHLKYEASYVFGRATSTSTNRNDRISDRYYAALDAVEDPGTGQITCRINLPGQTDIQYSTSNSTPYKGGILTFTPGQCVPLNILGAGSPSQAALDWVLADHSTRSRITQHVVSGSLSGDTGAFFNLPGGPVGFAVGAEYRKESSLFVPSDLSLGGYLDDSAPARIDRGSFDVKEIFAEINLPLLRDVPFAKSLSVGAAYRLSDYSTIGTTKTWNVNGSYSPISDITVRGTYSQAVRAPNITELFAGGSGTYEFITDPCGPERLDEGTQYRAANCAAALAALGVDQSSFDPADDQTSPQNNSLLGFQGGNPQLSEETAKTWTAGVVLRPQFIRGLSIAADWYDIHLTQAINYSTSQDVVDLCVDQPDLDNIYCDAITRSATTGYVSSFTIIPVNVASYDTSGLDLTVNYTVQPADNWGTFNFQLVGNYLHKLSFVPAVGADPENQRDEPGYARDEFAPLAPKFSASFDLTWKKGPATINYGINWWSKTRRVTREQEMGNPDYVERKYIWYKEKWEHELFISYDIEDRYEIYAGINNLWDTKPDVAGVAYPISAVGRSFYLGVKAKIF